MTFEQLPTVTRYREIGWVGPTTSPDQPAEGNSEYIKPTYSCPYTFKQQTTDGYIWRTGEIPATGVAPYGSGEVKLQRPDYFARYGSPYNYESTADWTVNVNIQLVARADDTWDVLRMEYSQTIHQRRVDTVPQHINNVDYSFYCISMSETDNPQFPEWQQGSYPAVSADYELTYAYHSKQIAVITCTMRYVCGEHSIEGFTEYHNGDITLDLEHSGTGSYRPRVGAYMAFNCSLRREEVTVWEMTTPFWHKRRELRRLETGHNSATENAPYDKNRNYVDTGNVYSGDPSEDMFWMNIVPKFLAGNKHVIEYNSNHALPVQTTVEELIHGIAVTRPVSGVSACDDPRNTRIVLLPDADAGCFY